MLPDRTVSLVIGDDEDDVRFRPSEFTGLGRKGWEKAQKE
jgi:hypothetical protein